MVTVYREYIPTQTDIILKSYEKADGTFGLAEISLPDLKDSLILTTPLVYTYSAANLSREGQFYCVILLPVGYQVTVDFGDGTATTYDGAGTSYGTGQIIIESAYTAYGKYDVRFSGDIDKITYMAFNNSYLSGDIVFFEPFHDLLSLSAYSAALYGDIRVLASTSMQVLNLSETNVVGCIGALNVLQGMRSIILSNTGVSGRLSSISDLTELETLRIAYTGVTGDLADLCPLTDLDDVDLRGSAVHGYNSTIADWNIQAADKEEVIIYLDNLMLTSAIIDQLLIDLAAGIVTPEEGGLISVAGNNGPRTSLSDAAVAALDAIDIEVEAN